MHTRIFFSHPISVENDNTISNHHSSLQLLHPTDKNNGYDTPTLVTKIVNYISLSRLPHQPLNSTWVFDSVAGTETKTQHATQTTKTTAVTVAHLIRAPTIDCIDLFLWTPIIRLRHHTFSFQLTRKSLPCHKEPRP